MCCRSTTMASARGSLSPSATPRFRPRRSWRSTANGGSRTAPSPVGTCGGRSRSCRAAAVLALLIEDSEHALAGATGLARHDRLDPRLQRAGIAGLGHDPTRPREVEHETLTRLQRLNKATGDLSQLTLQVGRERDDVAAIDRDRLPGLQLNGVDGAVTGEHDLPGAGGVH